MTMTGTASHISSQDLLAESTAAHSVPTVLDVPRPTNRIDFVFKHLAVCAFVFAVAWLAHFSQSRNMGFYSDDMTFAVPPLTWQLHDVARWINTQIRIYPEPQGRPLGFLLGLIIPYFGYQLGGVPGMFVLGWIILSVNTLLFYYLLRRCLRPPLPLFGAMFFLLFPADTTRPFLCHAHVLQPSLMFLLVAGHFYLNGRWWRRALSYVVIAACLVTYETALLPFLAVPLLERARDRRWLIRFGLHGVIVGAIVVAVYVTRMHGGEYRAVEASASKFKTVGEIVAGSIIGPVAVAKACVQRAFQGARDLFLRPAELIGFIAALGVFVLSFGLGYRRARVSDDASRVLLSIDVRRAARFGAAAMLVSYLFCFTHFPPWCTEGQETSVHLAATIGACTLLAAGAGNVYLLRPRQALLRRCWPAVSLFLIALYFTLIFSSSLDVQKAYVSLWRQKQQFWTQVLDLCPDIREGTMVVCDGQLAQPVIDHHAIWFMPPNCWSDSLVLRYSYQMPGAWKVIPQVSAFPAEVTGHGWRTWLTRDKAGRVVWKEEPYGRKKGDPLMESNTILLHVTPDGRVTRSQHTVDIEGLPFRLNDVVPRRPSELPTLPLYSILTNGPAGPARSH